MNLTEIEFKKYFPFNYPKYNQKEIIDKILTAFDNGKKHVILSAPTGSGKSVIAVTVANALYDKSHIQSYHSEIITSQKCLQEQYLHDLNIPIIYGKANYKCLKSPQLTCENGVCAGKTNKKICNNCPYLVALNTARTSPICSSNYALYLQRNRRMQNLYANFIVFDECHNLEEEILSLCNFKITEERLQYLGYNTKGYMPVEGISIDNLLIWLEEIINALKVEAVKGSALLNKLDLFNSLSKTGHISVSQLKEHKKHFARLQGIASYVRQISMLLEQYQSGNKFVTTFGEKEVNFKLLHGVSLFKQYIENSAEQFLHMSATILSKEQYCKSLGIDLHDAEYISCESNFPIYNRPIFYNPIGSMAYKDKRITIPKIVKRVDEILSEYNNEKGIIHTVSYELTEALLAGLGRKNGWRILVPRLNNRQEVLNHFYTSSDPLVLMSPSLTEGLDLKEDLARFCIVCKMPFANTNDKWIKERQQEDAVWYANNTCTTLMQMTGRVVRGETDIASTYILDSCFEFLVKKYGNLFPLWWQKSVFSIEDEKAIKEKQIL